VQRTAGWRRPIAFSPQRTCSISSRRLQRWTRQFSTMSNHPKTSDATVAVAHLAGEDLIDEWELSDQRGTWTKAYERPKAR